mgnify:CR=1 FL=1
MIEGMFNRPPEDDAIPVLTEIIAPTAAEPAPAEPDLQQIAEEARRDFRADPMSIDFAAELIPMPVDAPASGTDMPFPPAAIAHQTQLPPAVTVPYVAPTPDPSLPPPAVTDAAPVPAPPPVTVIRIEAPQPGADIPTLTASLAAGMVALSAASAFADAPTPNKGDTTWMLVSSLLVLLSTLGVMYGMGPSLAGDFMAANALVAAGLCIATGGAPEKVFAALETLAGAPGRLERVGERNGAQRFIDSVQAAQCLQVFVV